MVCTANWTKCCCVSAVSDGLLLVYSDIHIDVFEVLSGDWAQTINLKRTKPLMRTGVLNMVMISDLPHVAYLRNLHKGESGVKLTSKHHSHLSGEKKQSPSKKTSLSFIVTLNKMNIF